MRLMTKPEIGVSHVATQSKVRRDTAGGAACRCSVEACRWVRRRVDARRWVPPPCRRIGRVVAARSAAVAHVLVRRLGCMSQTPLADQPRPTTSLPTQYVPADVEGPLYERWVERGYFTADPESGKPPYCIVIPPPNVTGSLHLGHAFQHTLMDALTRRAPHAGLRRALAARHGPRRHRHAERSSSATSPRPRARAGTTTPARSSSRRSGSGRTSTAARSSARCAGSATASTGRASGSPWTRACPAPSRRSSSGSTTTT